MNIRSITLFADPSLDSKTMASFYRDAGTTFHVPVQTRRLALPPLATWWQLDKHPGREASRLAASWQQAGADYVNLGPVLLDDDAGWLDMLPELIASSEAFFTAAEIADRRGRVDVGRCLAVAELIGRISHLQPNGFGNLYFAALANCAPGSPFFPAGFHPGGLPAFAIAMEAADLAVGAFAQASTLDEARANLVAAVEHEARLLSQAAGSLAQKHGIAFAGIDFTLAPGVADGHGLAEALEDLGLAWLGAPGSLFAVAFTTEALARAQFRRCGFSSSFFPVLEDTVLATRAGEGRVTVSDLLSYAAVCGTGLDTVPLPGEISRETLAGILLDVGALATRLNKPLTARLMPLPGLTAGDPVHFDFAYFADSRVMAVPDASVSHLLAQPGWLELEAIHGRARRTEG